MHENAFSTSNDVTWSSLGTDENDSMPLGNGDIAINVWTEQNGDVLLLIAKSDAWSENGQLLKLGRVRIKLTPNPFVPSSSFTQTLKLATCEIELRTEHGEVRIWVDANQPVAHVEVLSNSPVKMEARAELLRLKSRQLAPEEISAAGIYEWANSPEPLTIDPDTVFPAKRNSITWCHYNDARYFQDGLHPNDDGFAVMADRLSREISQTILER